MSVFGFTSLIILATVGQLFVFNFLTIVSFTINTSSDYFAHLCGTFLFLLLRGEGGEGKREGNGWGREREERGGKREGEGEEREGNVSPSDISLLL